MTVLCLYMFVVQGIVENVSGLKVGENARDNIARRTLVSLNLCWWRFDINVNEYMLLIHLCFLSVFRGKVLGKLYRGKETRYDVQIIHTYRNGFRLEHREFLWAPNVCDCPHMEEGRQYIMMVRRHINYEHTLNRILMEEDSYVVPYRPREDELLRPLGRLCSNRGPKQPAELRGWACIREWNFIYFPRFHFWTFKTSSDSMWSMWWSNEFHGGVTGEKWPLDHRLHLKLATLRNTKINK